MMAADRMQRMRHEIMQTIQANNLPVTGDFWLMLVFRTEQELVKICQELHINTANLSNEKGGEANGSDA